MLVSHRIARESSWWPVFAALGEKAHLSLVLIGSAIYMREEEWFAGAAGSAEVSAVESGCTLPAGRPKIDMTALEKKLRSATQVISV